MYHTTATSSAAERSNYLSAQSIAHVIQLLRSRPMPTKVGEASVTSRLALLNGGIDELSFDAMKSPGKFTVRVFASSAPPPAPTPSSAAASLHKRGSSLSSSQPSYVMRRSSGVHYTGRSSSGLHSPPPLPDAVPDPEEDLFDMDPDYSLLLETWTFESSTYTGDSRSVLDIAQEATLARVICSYCTMHTIPETPFRRITLRSGDANANETEGDKWLSKKWNMKNNSRECLAITRRYPLKHGPLPQSCIDGTQPPSATPTTAGRKFNADGSTASVDDGNSPPVSSGRVGGRDRGLSRISPPCGPTSVGRLTNASFANSRHTSPPLHPTTFTTGSSGSTQYITPFELPPGGGGGTIGITHSRTNSGNCGIVGGGSAAGSVMSAGRHHTGSLVNSFDGGMHNHAMGSLTRNNTTTTATRFSSGNSPYERGTSTPNITLQISALAEKIQHSLRTNKPTAIDVEEEFKNLQMQAPLQRLH